MNKTELIDALAARYEGNRKQAAHALESVLDTITREVAKGEKVAITGFGSFEKAVRNARWVRNPQTGERMKSKKKSVPKFSAGKELKDVISGAKKLPKLTAATMPKPPASVRAAAAAVTGAATEGGAGQEAHRPRSPPPGQEDTAKKAPAKKATGQEGLRRRRRAGQEGAGQEGHGHEVDVAAKKATRPRRRRPRRHRRRRPPAKKARGEEGARQEGSGEEATAKKS